jgi:hypothetical protein
MLFKIAAPRPERPQEPLPILRPVAPHEDSERARVLPGQKLGMVSPELLEYAVRGVSVFWVIP